MITIALMLAALPYSTRKKGGPSKVPQKGSQTMNMLIRSTTNHTKMALSTQMNMEISSKTNQQKGGLIHQMNMEISSKTNQQKAEFI